MRKWRRALNLIDHLPQVCHFAEAVASDEEHLEQLIAMKKDQPETTTYHPPLADWDIKTELTAQMVDLQKELIAVQVARGGGKPGQVKPTPRPRNHMEELREQQRAQQHESLVNRVLKRGRTNG